MASNSSAVLDVEHKIDVKSRSYQLEMLEESLQRNIIVSMDTGSGKTHIAVLRIMIEMERAVDDRIIWFLAPSVALCEQQIDVLRCNIPALRARLLVGSDNVDRWSDQQTWDAALQNMHCIVSTHAVLADALSHGFVQMARLSLLIFDEAHHCNRDHPANKIMKDFYHPAKSRLKNGNGIPSILGLTASTIIRSNLKEIKVIEANLDAICRTPRLHRHELMKHVHRPELRRITYTATRMTFRPDLSVFRLQTLVEGSKPCNPAMLAWHKHLKKFSDAALHILEELGEWAAEYFVREIVAEISNMSRKGQTDIWGWDSRETCYYLDILASLHPLPDLPSRSSPAAPVWSDKVRQLIAILEKESCVDFAGIVFVRRRAVAAVLSKMLNDHPYIKNRLHSEPIMGSSNSAKKKLDIVEVLSFKSEAQSKALEAFRRGQTKLLVATDVLEEGIDVAKCHLVICFDPPPNLKSFIQRRGRARKEKSLFALFAAADDPKLSLAAWLKLEQEMIRLYQSDDRALEEITALETHSEVVKYQFQVPATGALLTAKSAMAHLYHFCAKLPPQPYLDRRPKFSFHAEEETGAIRSTITLPASVNRSVRQVLSARSWVTEKAAAMDAAFQAYMALFRAGLVNNNLLPLAHENPVVGDDHEEQTSDTEIEAQFDPWYAMAQKQTSKILYQTKVIVEVEGDTQGGTPLLIMTTSDHLLSPKPFLIYWDRNTTKLISFATSQAAKRLDSEYRDGLARITQLLLKSTHHDGARFQQGDSVAFFTPYLEDSQLVPWLARNDGRSGALDHLRAPSDPEHMGFVRSSTSGGLPCLFRRWRIQSPHEIFVDCVLLPSRRNFLKPFPPIQNLVDIQDDAEENLKSHDQLYSAEQCTFDCLPAQEARKALIIPAIMQHVQVHLTADCLRQTVLKDICIRDIQNVITAISTPAAQWSANYQQFEFLGDTLLKFAVSQQLYADHPHWHEGCLTRSRANLVSNANLAMLALRAGLGPFILTTSFPMRKWRMPLISSAQRSDSKKRLISRKVLSDVVEALIGAAFVDGGYATARLCIHRFMSGFPSESPGFDHLLTSYTTDTPLSTTLAAERVIGYTFRTPALLREALTHPSMESDVCTESYQRLEFLGDAVLDMIVVSAIWRLKRDLSPYSMTMMKAALVNSGLLGFFCMQFGIDRESIKIKHDGANCLTKEQSIEQVQLWRFMRHHSDGIVQAQQSCRERHEQLCEEIQACLDHGANYPWRLLGQLNSDKFYSDIVESVIGAIYVDSNGDLASCTAFVERIGIMAYLLRLVTQEIDIEQPKTRLQHIVGSRELRYIVEIDRAVSDMYRCRVEMDGVVVGPTVEGASREEVIVRAADGAISCVQALV